MSIMASDVLSIGWKRQLSDQNITWIKHFLASNNSEYSCFRKRRQLLPFWDVSGLHLNMRGGGRGALWGNQERVFHWLTRNPTISVQHPGASGAGRVGGAGRHPGAVPGNHRDQVSQPCDSGFWKYCSICIYMMEILMRFCIAILPLGLSKPINDICERLLDVDC